MYSNHSMRFVIYTLVVVMVVVTNFSTPQVAFAEHVAVKEFRSTLFMQQLLDLFLQSPFNIHSSNASVGVGSSDSLGGSKSFSDNASSADTVSLGTGFSVNQSYGGKVVTAVPCTCSAGDFLITLGPPSAGTYLFSPISVPTVYKYGLVTVPGVTHLGMYRPGGLCWMTATPCFSIPTTRGTITSVGTSLSF